MRTTRTTPTRVSRLSRLALATAGVLAMWHGAVAADSAAPSPSSAEVDTPAAVQPFAVGKQLAAVGAYPGYVGSWEIYYWTDGSFSSYDIAKGVFNTHYSATDSRLVGNWPAGKQLAAVGAYPGYVGSWEIYYWTDGSFSSYDIAKGAFGFHYSATDSRLVGNWPAGKQLAAVGTYPGYVGSWQIYYWSDGSFSSYDIAKGAFGFHYSATDSRLVGNWPAGKQLAAVGTYPGYVGSWQIYYWSDGSFSSYDIAKGAFGFHYSATDSRLVGNWPVFTLDPAQHEVRDVRVNQYSAGNGAIYANGRMQYQVVVRAQIVDRAGKGVDFSDRGTGLNRAGQLRDLVTLYRGHQGVDRSGANLAIDKVGDFASTSWTASRTDAGYDKYLNVFEHYSEQIDGTIVEHAQDDDAAYPASDGWNTYAYWVSSTEQTGADPMRICARVGSYGSAGEGYYDSCANGRDESAKVRALPPRRFNSSDYKVESTKIPAPLGEAYHNYLLMSLFLNHGSIFGYEYISKPTGFNTSCVAGMSYSWRESDWKNNNLSLHIMPPKSTTSSIHVYDTYGDWGGIDVPVSGMNANALNFVSARAVSFGSNGNGVWSNCTAPRYLWERIQYDAAARVRFFDNFGNSGELTFERTHWDYLIKG
ncbi:hypothetical protein RA180_21950 [Aeromonas salmonicida]|uniref:hypothetical protein n=1 Tax=Aeromonas salmonicida TaxID=645 RepID=UPI0027966CE4|nr:hypothetical protein [Aeromonas salmonicida]MDQ1886657.1 hypothetical protein [Aeromonas salmonicida]